MKVILYKYKILLAILIVLLISVSLISFIKVEYSLVAPGYNDDISTIITVDIGNETTGSFHTTSVIVVNEVSLLQRFIADLEHKVTLREYPEYYDYIDIDDLEIMGYQMKDDSFATSLVTAIKKSGYSIAYKTYATVYLTYTYLDEDTLQLGDKIISVNGLDPNTEFGNVGCNEIATFIVLRDNVELTFDITKHQHDNGTCAFGAYIKDFTEITATEIRYNIAENNTGGPSGGLMQSLYIFNQLTPNDMTGGLRIAGTGTIDVYGNVGKIGGIEQKIITSAMNGIDIFFVPYLSDNDTDNYIEALRVLETLDSDMILVPVDSFNDAIDYLESRFGGAFNE
jgi:PDZ domain-containing protein